MAGVPEIQAPSVQPEAQPAVEQPVPPPGAFSGAHIGAGLEQAGEHLFSVGWEAYERASEARAQQKENEFQTQALKIRDQYRNLYNLDAVGAHEKATQAMEEARQKISEGLNKRGLSIYNNNSLRNARLMQESIDSHFEQQNRSYQIGEYKKGQDLDTQGVAKLAADGNLRGVQEKIEMMQGKADDFAKAHGLDPEQEKLFVASKGAHAAIKTLLDSKNVDGAQALYDKYGENLDPGFQAYTQRALHTQGAANDVEKILANIPRIDADGKTNPRGQLDQNALRAATAVLPSDERGEKTRDLLRREAAGLDAQFKADGEQMMERMYRLGEHRGPGGRFGVPDNTIEWQEFASLHPKMAKALRAEAHGVERQAVSEGRGDVAYAGKEAFGRQASRLYEASSDELKQIAPESVAAQMRMDGARAQDIEKAQGLLKSLQGKPDATGKEITNIAREVLNTAKNPRFTSGNLWQAVTYLHGLHTAKPEMTQAQLGDDLQKYIVKNWIGKASLSTPPLPKLPAKSAQAPDYDWDPIKKKLVPRVR